MPPQTAASSVGDICYRVGWHALAKAASWSNPQEIKDKFASASFLANNRVVINISGNRYRLVVKVD